MAEEEAMAEATEELHGRRCGLQQTALHRPFGQMKLAAPHTETLAEQFKADYGITLVIEQVAERYEQFNIAAPAGEPGHHVSCHDRLGGFVESGLLRQLI